MDLSSKLRHIADFPRPGIDFIDISPVLQDGEVFQYSVDCLLNELDGVDFDKVVGSEARGFIFGAPISYVTGKGFVPVRKKGKLPCKTISACYDLEYGSDTLEMNRDAILPGEKIVIIDDLLATGGTVFANIKMIESLGGKVEKILFLVELRELKGREKLKDYPIQSIIEL